MRKNMFEQLREIIELQQNGRTNAAKSLWKALIPEFRICVTKAIIGFHTHRLPLEDNPDLVLNLTSPYGEFTIATEKIDETTLVPKELRDILPEVIYG